MLFMGVCSLVGGALALLLPETLGQPLVEQIHEVDDMAKDTKSFFSWWSTERVERHLARQVAERDNSDNKKIGGGDL